MTEKFVHERNLNYWDYTFYFICLAHLKEISQLSPSTVTTEKLIVKMC